MPRYDVRCVRCGAVRSDVWFSSWKDAAGNRTIALAPCGHQPYSGEPCPEIYFERMPSAPNFTVSGYNAKNGYSSGH